MGCDKWEGCCARLVLKAALWLADPTQSADGIGTGNIKTGGSGGNQGDTPVGWVHGEMDILDCLPRHPDREIADLDLFMFNSLCSVRFRLTLFTVNWLAHTHALN